MHIVVLAFLRGEGLRSLTLLLMSDPSAPASLLAFEPPHDTSKEEVEEALRGGGPLGIVP